VKLKDPLQKKLV